MYTAAVTVTNRGNRRGSLVMSGADRMRRGSGQAALMEQMGVEQQRQAMNESLDR